MGMWTYKVQMWLTFNISKHPQLFSCLFQGEQGPPGQQGPEEVIEYPPEFLPPKGLKVNLNNSVI